jgi:hypothetical protein
LISTDLHHNIITDPEKYYQIMGKNSEAMSKTALLLKDYIKPEN